MSKELFFIGQPCVFKPGIIIYPPTVKQVITEEAYSIYARLLTYSQEEIEDEFLAENRKLERYPTPLEFLLNNCYHNKTYEKTCKEAFNFFLHSEVNFFYEEKMILIGNLSEVLQTI